MTTVTAPRAPDHEAARRAMIDSQLRTSGVNEGWVLAAMASLPREGFVPAAWREAAYIDRAIPLGDGGWLAPPLVHARMLAEAAPAGTDRALLVGDAAGYLAALLRPRVGTLEVAAPAEAVDHPPAGPFTLIVIDGAIENLPDALADALADTGRLVTGIVARGVTRLALGRKAAGKVALLPLAEIGIPVLTAFAAPQRWRF